MAHIAAQRLAAAPSSGIAFRKGIAVPRVQVSQRLQLRASETSAAPTKEPKQEKKQWTVPELNPDTPSPIFGGSTGGLLKKAQVPYPISSRRLHNWRCLLASGTAHKS